MIGHNTMSLYILMRAVDNFILTKENGGNFYKNKMADLFNNLQWSQSPLGQGGFDIYNTNSSLGHGLSGVSEWK